LAITTLSAVQQNLRIGSTDAAILSALIPRATKIAERFCGVDSFEDATYTEYHDGECADRVVLKNIPVNSVTSAALVYGTASATIASTTYTFDPDTGELGFRGPSGHLAWDMGLPYGGGARFPAGFRGVRVTYNGGFSAVPADMTQAAAELVCLLYRNGNVNHAVQSESLGQYSYTRAGGGAGTLNDFLEERFGAWKRPGV
jgi:hypothetical protein